MTPPPGMGRESGSVLKRRDPVTLTLGAARGPRQLGGDKPRHTGTMPGCVRHTVAREGTLGQRSGAPPASHLALETGQEQPHLRGTGSGRLSEWGPVRGVMSADSLAAPWGLRPGK